MKSLLPFMRQHWKANDLIRMSYADALVLGFLLTDAKFINEQGLPNWSAPNIWIHAPMMFDEKLILLGESRDSEKIVYEKLTGKLLIMNMNGQQDFLATSIYRFMQTLLDYAGMVDAAIMQNGKFSFVQNAIPDLLIDKFEKSIENVDRHPGAFWTKEIVRLRSHTSD